MATRCRWRRCSLPRSPSTKRSFSCDARSVRPAGAQWGCRYGGRDRQVNWLGDSGDEPALSLLPERLWLLGLGHLGQAYLWALGLLPYVDPSSLSLVLQDVDVVTPSTESASILTDAKAVGQKKTRAMAACAGRAAGICDVNTREMVRRRVQTAGD